MEIKKIFLLLLLITCILPTGAQNKIGDNPKSMQDGSLLELESLTKGLRLPRISLNDVQSWTLDGSAVSGMLIFNETGAAPKGMYYWNMDLLQWVRIVTANELGTLITGNTTVSNNSTVNTLTTVVNGVTGLGVDIIKNNSLAIVNGILTSTINGVISSPGLQVMTSADNGLTQTNGKAQLGGILTAPTTITTSSVNTLSLQGVQTGDASTDSLLVIAPNTGVIRKLSAAIGGATVLKSISFSGSNGEKLFSTPAAISDIRKIQVYRNGINVEFIKADDNHIELEDPASCYVNDEIKIIQSK